MRIVGDKIYEICNGCGDIVCLNKRLFGSLHICLTDKEKFDQRFYIQNKININSKKLTKMI